MKLVKFIYFKDRINEENVKINVKIKIKALNLNESISDILLMSGGGDN